MPEGLPANYQWVTTASGQHLSGRKKTGTKPEMMLRSALHRRGLRYRLGRSLGPRCTPDLLFSRLRVAVFVDGCYWHGCPRHGRSEFAGPNAELWVAKMARNRRNDAAANAFARGEHYTVLRLWECLVMRDPAAAVERVIATLGTDQRRPKNSTAASTAPSPSPVTVSPRDS